MRVLTCKQVCTTWRHRWATVDEHLHTNTQMYSELSDLLNSSKSLPRHISVAVANHRLSTKTLISLDSSHVWFHFNATKCSNLGYVKFCPVISIHIFAYSTRSQLPYYVGDFNTVLLPTGAATWERIPLIPWELLLWKTNSAGEVLQLDCFYWHWPAIQILFYR